MFEFVALLIASLVIVSASGALLWSAWRYGIGESGSMVLVALAQLTGAVVLLIAAGEGGWPVVLRVAAGLAVGIGLVSLPLGAERHERITRWETFEGAFRAYAEEQDRWHRA